MRDVMRTLARRPRSSLAAALHSECHGRRLSQKGTVRCRADGIRSGPDPHDWFVDIPERGMIGDNWARCAGSDLFDHPQDHDMDLLHHNDALYREDMPRSSARHARPEILAVFEEGLDCLQDAKSRQPAPPLAAERERGLGNLWNEAHE